MFPIDLLADLPPPRHDEPSLLRGDIADELADHLQCAYRREILKDGDDDAAQRRVLDRFGDPKKLARRLWWQSMRSRIMGQRIFSGLQWLVSLTAAALAGTVLWQQSQMLDELRASKNEERTGRQALTAVLDQLRAQTTAQRAGTTGQLAGEPSADQRPAQLYETAPFDSGNPVAMAEDSVRELDQLPAQPTQYDSVAGQDSWIPVPVYDDPGFPPLARDDERATLTVQCVQEKADGPPARVDRVSIRNVAGIEFSPDAQPIAGNHTQFRFKSLDPNHYEIAVLLSNGQSCTRPVLIRDEKPRELVMICPAPRNKIPVSISIKPLPGSLLKKKWNVNLYFWPGAVEIGGAKWTIQNPPQKVSFDARTGLPTAIGEDCQRLDLSDLPAEERSVFLPSGNVFYRFEMYERLEREGYIPVFAWPRDLEGGESALKHTITADETACELELPQAYLDLLQSADAAPANSPPYGVQPVPR